MPIELDELERRRDAARDRARGAAQGDRRRLEGAPRGAREGARRRRGARPARCKQRWEAEKAAIAGDPRDQVASSRRSRSRIEQAEREADFAHGRRARSTAPSKELNDRLDRAGGRAGRAPGPGHAAQGGGRRRRHRRGRRAVDRHPGQPSCSRARRPKLVAAWRSALHERVVGQDEAIAGRRPTPSAAPAPASRTRAARSARSCSSARPASARPSSPGRSPSSCSTTSTRWSAST